MDEHGDWDLLHSATSPRKSLKEVVTDSPTSPTCGGYESDDAGAVKPDYFALDSGGKYSKKAPSEDSESDNPSWVDPEFFPLNQPREFWSDESNYTAEGREIGDPFDWERENRDDSAESGEKEKEKEKEIGRKWDAWWKFPFEMVKLCVCRVRPVWSIPVAAAILGVVILGRKLLRSEERYDGSGSLLPFKMVLDEKRATQLKARASRLNEALSVVMRVPLFRTSFPPGVAPWPVLGMY